MLLSTKKYAFNIFVGGIFVGLYESIVSIRI